MVASKVRFKGRYITWSTVYFKDYWTVQEDALLLTWLKRKLVSSASSLNWTGTYSPWWKLGHALFRSVGPMTTLNSKHTQYAWVTDIAVLWVFARLSCGHIKYTENGSNFLHSEKMNKNSTTRAHFFPLWLNNQDILHDRMLDLQRLPLTNYIATTWISRVGQH